MQRRCSFHLTEIHQNPSAGRSDGRIQLEMTMNKYIILSTLAGTLALSTSAFARDPGEDLNIAVGKVRSIHGDTVTLRNGMRFTASTPVILKGMHVGEKVSVTYSNGNSLISYERA